MPSTVTMASNKSDSTALPDLFSSSKWDESLPGIVNLGTETARKAKAGGKKADAGYVGFLRSVGRVVLPPRARASLGRGRDWAMRWGAEGARFAGRSVWFTFVSFMVVVFPVSFAIVVRGGRVAWGRAEGLTLRSTCMLQPYPALSGLSVARLLSVASVCFSLFSPSLSPRHRPSSHSIYTVRPHNMGQPAAAEPHERRCAAAAISVPRMKSKNTFSCRHTHA